MCEKGKDFEVYNYGGYECWRTPPGNFEIINYRYLLKKRGDNPLIIIGCNPSIANEERQDRTMGRVESFCQNKRYGGYIMLNLYPQITPRVRELPRTLDDNIHAVNVCAVNIGVIGKVLQENNSSDILFAFGTIINRRIRLFRKCYQFIIGLIRVFIDKGVIDENQIKKLALGNATGNVVRQFNYFPHFLNHAFNEENMQRIFDTEPFDFEGYHIG